jgi:hypothetical protein
MHSYPHGGDAVAGKGVVSDPESKHDGLSRIFDSKHEGVADRLDLRCPKHRQLGSDDVAEVRHQRCGLFVSVCLGQRREAGYVGKQERGR